MDNYLIIFVLVFAVMMIWSWFAPAEKSIKTEKDSVAHQEPSSVSESTNSSHMLGHEMGKNDLTSPWYGLGD